MPIQKFRSVEDMPPVPPCETVDADCLRRIARLWARASAWSGMVYPRGVFKFRTIEEAQAARERVTQENVDRLRREREGARAGESNDSPP